MQGKPVPSVPMEGELTGFHVVFELRKTASVLLRVEGNIPPLLLVGITVTSLPSFELLSELPQSRGQILTS